jgi:hypothetical protein
MIIFGLLTVINYQLSMRILTTIPKIIDKDNTYQQNVIKNYENDHVRTMIIKNNHVNGHDYV